MAASRRHLITQPLVSLGQTGQRLKRVETLAGPAAPPLPQH